MSYEPKPYPRMLFKGQTNCIVNDEAEELAKVEEGWENQPSDEPSPDLGQAPLTGGAPCANCAALQAEVEQLKADLAKLTAPKALEDMRAGELLQYAKDNNLDIGDMKPQQGAEKILAAIRAAEAKG